MTKLKQFREKNPAYDDMPDDQLVSALHQKYYSDIPKAEFDSLMGYVSPPPEPGLIDRGIGAVREAFSGTATGEAPTVRAHPGEQAPAPAKRTDTVMANAPLPDAAPRATPANEKQRQFIKASYDNYPESRAGLLARKDWMGDIARQIDAEYKAGDAATANLPTAQALDPRQESRVSRNIGQGMKPETAMMTAQSQAAVGEDAPVGQITETPDTLADKVAREYGDSDIVRGAVDLAGSVAKVAPTTGKMALDTLQLVPLIGRAAEMGSDALAEVIEDISKGQSRQMQGKATQLAEVVRNGTPDQVMQLVLQNPDLLADVAIPSAGSIFLIGGAGGAIGKGVASRYAGKVSPRALARIQQRAATDGAVWTNAAVNAGAAYDETEGSETAKYTAALIAGLGTRAVGKMTAGGAEGAIARGGSGASNPIYGAARIGAGEMAQEFGEGSSEAFGVQTGEIIEGARDGYNVRQIANQGTLESVAAGPMGGAVGAMTSGGNRNEQSTPLDAAGNQGQGADPRGSAGLASDGGVGAAGGGQSTGAPARSGEQGVAVGAASPVADAALAIEATLQQREAEAFERDPVEGLVAQAENAAVRQAATPPQPNNGIDIDQDALLAAVEARMTPSGNVIVEGDSAAQLVRSIVPQAPMLPRADGAVMVSVKFAGPVMEAIQGAKQRVSVAFGGDGAVDAPDVAEFKAQVSQQKETGNAPQAEQVAQEAQAASGQEGAQSVEQAAEVAQPTQPAKPKPSRLKADPALAQRAAPVADDLRAMSQDAGWAEEGGKLIRDAEGKASRTKWIPRAEWFVSGMEADPATLAQHIEDMSAGRGVPAKSRRTIEGMIEWLDRQRGATAPTEDSSAYDFEAIGFDVMSEPARLAVDAFDDFDAMTAEEEAAAMRALGFTEEEIRNGQGQTAEGQGGSRADDAGREAADNQGDAGTDSTQADSGAEAGQEGLTLSSYTNEDIAKQEASQREREEFAAKAEREVTERERKAREQAEVRARSEVAADTFELGMDPMANLTGQGDIFSQAADPAPAVDSTGSPSTDSKASRQERAIRILLDRTDGNGSPDALSGPEGAEARIEIVSALTGRSAEDIKSDKRSRFITSVAEVERLLHEAAGIEGGSISSRRERFLDWIDSREAGSGNDRRKPEEKRNDRRKAKVERAAISDFGEKIGGARKDVWSSFKDKLTEVSDGDIATQPLSKSWPAPDYQAMLNEGADPWAVAMIRSMRDAIPTKPQKGYKVKQWAELVKMLRDVASGALDGNIREDSTRRIIGQMASRSRHVQDIMGRIDLYLAVGHDKSLAGVRLEEHFYTLYKGRENVNLWAVEQDAKATAFSNWPRELATGDTKEEAITAFKAKYDSLNINEPAAKQVSFDIYSKTGEKGYWIGKKVGRNYIDLERFDTLKEAREYKNTNTDKLTEKLEKAKEIPRSRPDTNAPRVGVDMRNAQDVTPEMFSDAFGFKGVEFGNYVEQKRRQQDLNDAYDALMDMAAILGVPPKALSLNGELGLAFGARGKGGIEPASAHYEPGKVVINLTKGNGAGSLGHEWWHALDNYFSRMRGKAGDMTTEALDVSLAERGSEFAANTKVRREMVQAFGEVMKAISQTALRERSYNLDRRRSKEYWTTKPEMSARAFESYLISKLQDQNASNDYLANIVDETTWKAAEALGWELGGSYPYPTAGEVPAIRSAFDNFFNVIESKETGKGVMLFSRAGTSQDLLDAEVARWSDIVEQHLTGQLDRTRTHILLTETPASMQALGLPNLQVRTGPHMMDYANVRLTRDQMDSLPRELANPRLAYIHDGNNGLSINFVTSIERNGEHVVIALKPNQHVREAGNAHFVATIVNVRTDRIVGEFRKGHGLYVSNKDALPGLRDATDFAQKKNGRRASEVREQMSRNYGLASLVKRLIFKSDLVNIIQRGQAQYSFAGQNAADDSALTPADLRAAVESRYPSLAPAIDVVLKRGEEGKPGGVVLIERAGDLASTFASKTGRTTDEARRMLGLDQPAILESALNPVTLAADFLSDLSEAPAFVEQGFGALNVPGKRAMLHAVLLGTQDLKILKPIIEFIPVDVMDVLSRQQLSPEVLLNDESMLQVNADGTVVASNPDLTIPEGFLFHVARGIAAMRAKELAATANRGRTTTNRGATSGAVPGNAPGLVPDLSAFFATEMSGGATNFGRNTLKLFTANGALNFDPSLGTARGHVAVEAAELGRMLEAAVIDMKNGGALRASNVGHGDNSGLINGVYDSTSGLTFLVAPNLDTDTAPAVLLHEAMHGKQRDDIDRRALALIESRGKAVKPVREFLARVYLRMQDAGEVGNASEASAYLVEQAAIEGKRFSAADGKLLYWIDRKLGKRVGDIVRDFVAMVRMWGMKRGMKLNPSVDDLVALAMDNLREMAKGRVVTEGNADEVMQSVAVIPETINVDGVDRPTRNSNGRLIHLTEAGIRNFWRWFGDSKVVDPDAGQPLVMYHGTNADFMEFAPGDGMLGRGIYFTPKAEAAPLYPKMQNMRAVREGRDPGPVSVMPVFVSLKNPLTFTELPVSKVNAAKVAAQGFDGIALLSPDGSIKELTAFRPEQIKSATGNNGNFNPTGSSINFSRAARTAPAIPVPATAPATNGAVAAQPARANQQTVTPPEETRFQAAQRRTQDKLNRFTVIKEWLADQGVKLSEQADVYKAEERMHSRFSNKAEDFREKTVRPLVEKIQKAGYAMEDVAQFLHAQHAKERNEQIARINPQMPDGGSGMKTADAAKVMASASPELKALANEFRSITEQTKQILLNAGLLSQDMANAWSNTYQHYVPLKGGPDTGIVGAGKGLKAKYKPKRALGHEMREEGEWIVENILADHERALMLAEKNRVGQSLIQMAIEAGRDDLITVSKPQKRAILKDNVAYEVLFKGKPIGSFTSLEAARAFKATAPAAMKNASPSHFGIRKTSDPAVVYTASPMLADNEVEVYVKGQAIRVQINDELLARAYGNMGVEALSSIMRVGSMLNSYLSRIYTGYNPEFILTNIIRDFTTGVINITGEEGAAMAAKAIKNYVPSFISLFRYAVTRNPDQWIADYRADGGNTGAAYLSDLERLGEDVMKEYAAFKGVAANIKAGDVRGAVRAAGRKVFDKTLIWIERVNQAGENAMRLAVYRAMRESGQSRAAAASLAKNATVNFNRKGELGQRINAMYLFYNAGVQGSAAILHANIKGKHKYQANTVSAGMMALGYVMASALGGDDEEKEYDQLSGYTKARNMVIKAGEGWVKVPVPYGYGFFWNLGRSIADAQRKDDLGNLPWQVATSFIEEFTPFGNAVGEKPDGEHTFLYSLPTIAQIIGAPLMNKSGMGGPIYPESGFDGSQPDREKMWRATKGTMADGVAGALEMAGLDVSPETIKFLARTFTGGAGNLVSTAIDSTWLKLNGADLEVKEMPFVRKLYTETDVRDARRVFWESAKEAKQASEAFDRARKVMDLAKITRISNEDAELLAMDRMADKYSKALRAHRDWVDRIRNNETYSIAEKRMMMKDVENQERKLYEQYVEVFGEAMDRRKARQ